MKCRRCFDRPAISVATPYCEVCLYREQSGEEKAARQVYLAEKVKVERGKREGGTKAS